MAGNTNKIEQAKQIKKDRRKQFIKTFFSGKQVYVGVVILIIMVAGAILAPLVSPYDPNKQELMNALAKPSAEHWFGTDDLGRDILSRIIYGSRISMIVGLVSTAIAGICGMAVGLAAGYLGGKADAVIMRIMDAMMSIPVVILALVIGSILGKGLFNICLCLGIVMIPAYARTTRGQVLQVKQLDYVIAGKLNGATALKNAVKHVMPNCLAPNLVLMTMNLGTAILTEASLSFLGMGINPPTATWGAMVSGGYKYLATEPWIAIIPGIFVLLTVWAFNICGDAVRDALDPRLSRRG